MHAHARWNHKGSDFLEGLGDIFSFWSQLGLTRPVPWGPGLFKEKGTETHVWPRLWLAAQAGGHRTACVWRGFCRGRRPGWRPAGSSTAGLSERESPLPAPRTGPGGCPEEGTARCGGAERNPVSWAKLSFPPQTRASPPLAPREERGLPASQPPGPPRPLRAG